MAENVKWYQCAKCDAGYPDQDCTCLPKATAPERPSNKVPTTFPKCEVAGCPYEAETNLKCCRGHEMQKPGTVFTIGAADPVNHPAHYQGKVETIDAIEAALGLDGFRAYCRGNAIKYLSRLGKKGPAAEDAQKAQWYVDKLAESYL